MKGSAGGSNNGSSWGNAYTNLQSALAASSNGSEIWVAAGTYKPTGNLDRTVSFTLKNGVAIYGGFAGTETLRVQRNPVSNVTILSGNIGASNNDADNSYHVITGGGTNSTAILDGFTVTAGKANGANAIDQGGAGLYNESSSPQLRNIIFRDNNAVSGAGMYNSSSSPTLSDVTFSGNTSGSEGGGMYNVFSSSPLLTNVTFKGNTSSYGGGMENVFSSNPTLINVTFDGNWAAFYGGAIYNQSSNPALTNVTFSENQAGYGSAMYNSSSSPHISNGIFWADHFSEIQNSSSAPVIDHSIIAGGCPAGSTCTTTVNTDPLLGPLQNNGGLTQTMAISSGSPAIDTGNDSNCPAADQRGVSRPQGSHCDIGAYEYQQLAPIFQDVPSSYWAWSYIERLYNAGITGGCATNPLKYCPETIVTRAQMAVFLLRGIHGSSYSPPAVGASTGFSDVPANYWAAAWVKQLAAEGITGGCGNGKFCPEYPVTRDQMAVFLLRSEYGSTYSPPAVGGSTGFGDVPPDHWAAAWIKQLVTEGITAGCGNNNYCPSTVVNRAQMAVFLVRTFNVP